MQFSSKTMFSTHPDQTVIYTTSSPKTPFAFLPRSPIASHLPPTMWALFLHSFHPLPLYLAVLHFISFLYLSHLLSCTMTKRRVRSSRVREGPKNNIKNGQNCPQPQKGVKCYFCSVQLLSIVNLSCSWYFSSIPVVLWCHLKSYSRSIFVCCSSQPFWFYFPIEKEPLLCGPLSLFAFEASSSSSPKARKRRLLQFQNFPRTLCKT